MALPDTIDVSVNLRTAKALDLAIPATILRLAERVID
jgi:hypothetical protein